MNVPDKFNPNLINAGIGRRFHARKGSWNKALDETLKPNAKCKVGNIICETYELDSVKKVSGEPELGKLGRNGCQQGKSVTLSTHR